MYIYIYYRIYILYIYITHNACVGTCIKMVIVICRAVLPATGIPRVVPAIYNHIIQYLRVTI